ncbi:MAG: nuclear transport factor 2 family protein [Ramlibacter sp.]|nr:nuclear transport factor 2 family protein [Ramlibacter sp.]
MHPNQLTIETFYTAFAQLDAQTMATCYADNVTFKDEVFTLTGKREVTGMWRMLAEATKAKGADVWSLKFRDVLADGAKGSAHWDAHYRFSATGRIVDNAIDAKFEFDPQGKIVKHHDSFDFWKWSRQALGMPGLLLGWTPIIHNKVRATAAGNLQKFMARGAAS